jgi:hypothetical protein
VDEVACRRPGAEAGGGERGDPDGLGGALRPTALISSALCMQAAAMFAFATTPVDAFLTKLGGIGLNRPRALLEHGAHIMSTWTWSPR